LDEIRAKADRPHNSIKLENKSLPHHSALWFLFQNGIHVRAPSGTSAILIVGRRLGEPLRVPSAAISNVGERSSPLKQGALPPT
jgi:hypothetical protein